MATTTETTKETTMTKQQARRIANAEQRLEWAQSFLVEAMRYGVNVDRAIDVRTKYTRILLAARRDAGLER